MGRAPGGRGRGQAARSDVIHGIRSEGWQDGVHSAKSRVGPPRGRGRREFGRARSFGQSVRRQRSPSQATVATATRATTTTTTTSSEQGRAQGPPLVWRARPLHACTPRRPSAIWGSLPAARPPLIRRRPPNGFQKSPSRSFASRLNPPRCPLGPPSITHPAPRQGRRRVGCIAQAIAPGISRYRAIKTVLPLRAWSPWGAALPCPACPCLGRAAARTEQPQAPVTRPLGGRRALASEPAPAMGQQSRTP